MSEDQPTVAGLQPAAEDESVSPSVAPIVRELEIVFDNFNAHFFDSALLTPVITLSQKGTKSAKGWCTEKKVWAQTGGNDSAEKFYEINICPEYLNRPIEEIAEIMLHEMVHLFNIIHGIQDCSSNGQYHNKHFKESAEQHGLNVERVQNYGYAQTSLKQETIDFIRSLDLTAFDLYREGAQKSVELVKITRKPSSTRTYVCPKCKTLIRATKKVQVRCDGCNVLFRDRQELEQEQAGIFTPLRRKG